jgi:hypothetical protein
LPVTLRSENSSSIVWSTSSRQHPILQARS